MSQGLCDFDGEGLLVTCGRHFIDLYNGDELARPGTPLADILEYRVQTGSYNKNPATFGDRLNMLARNQQTDIVGQGRALLVVFGPLQQWVATHEDVRHDARRHAFLLPVMIH